MKIILGSIFFSALIACDSPGSGGATDFDSSSGGDSDVVAFDATDDGEEGVELTITEEVPVDFGSMLAGVRETAIVDLDDLRQEPAYIEAIDRLKCVSIERAASFLKLTSLQPESVGELQYEAAVAPRGEAQFTRLALFAGSAATGAQVPFSDGRISVDAAGVQTISQVLLGNFPALSVQISANVPEDVSDLQITLSLSLHFSDQQQQCD